MSGWLYLIRNRDLYKIGITKKFESRMRQLKPDNIVAKLASSASIVTRLSLTACPIKKFEVKKDISKIFKVIL